MKWTRPSQATIDYFERLAPGPPLETRKMFGLPCRFLNGYVLVGIFGNELMLHLSKEDRAACIAAGAAPFRPMGREMKAYVAIKPNAFKDHDLKWWIVRGMRYLATLEPRIQEPRTSRRPKPPTPATPAKKAKTTKAANKSKKTAKTAKTKTPSAKVAPKPAAKKVARKAKPTKTPTKKAASKRRPAAKKRPSRR